MALKLESGLTLDLPAVHALVHKLEYVDIRQPIEHCPGMLHLHFGLGTIPTHDGSHHTGMDVPHPHFHLHQLGPLLVVLSAGLLRIASCSPGTSVVIAVVPSSSLLESLLLKPLMVSSSAETSPRTLCVSTDVEAALCNSTLMLLSVLVEAQFVDMCIQVRESLFHLTLGSP